MTTAANKGKWAEKQVQAWLDQATNAYADFAYHRYPDARSARGALAAQPADYLLAFRQEAKVIHLEVKETMEKNRLPRSKIGQYGKLRKFWWAGITPKLIVYRGVYMDWVIFDECDLFPEDDSLPAPASFAFGGRPTYLSAAYAMQSLFTYIKVCP